MKRTLIVLVSTVVLVAGCRAEAEGLKDTEAAVALAESFMEILGSEEGGVQAAFDEIAPCWPIGGQEVGTMVMQTIQTRPLLEERYGERLGHLLISQEKVADTVLRLVYLERFEYSALRWSFYFYRTSDGWIVNTMHWDDQIMLLFGNAPLPLQQ